MTTDDLIALSKRVAEKLGINPYTGSPREGQYRLWLYEDSARVFDLLGEHAIQLTHHTAHGLVYATIDSIDQDEEYADHNDDRNLAARVAILKALEAL